MYTKTRIPVLSENFTRRLFLKIKFRGILLLLIWILFFTDYLIVEDSGCGDAAVLKDYELKKVKYTIKGQHFAGTEELTIPIDKEKLEVMNVFTQTLPSPSILLLWPP